MTEITVEFTGSLISHAKVNEATISLAENADVVSLLKELENKLGKGRLLTQTGHSLATKVLVLVNGVEVSVLLGLRTQLHHRDHVTLIPVFHGG